jgi:hypothetical protein
MKETVIILKPGRPYQETMLLHALAFLY